MKKNKFIYSLLLLVAASMLAGCSGDIGTPPPPGPKWLVFTPKNSPLKSSIVRCLYASEDEYVWIGTDSGAYSYHRGLWGVYIDSLLFTLAGPAKAETVATVSAVCQSKDGSIWFGLNGGGLERYNTNSRAITWTRYRYPTIEFDIVNAVAGEFLQRGDVYVGTIFGASRFIPDAMIVGSGTWRQYDPSTGNSPIPGEPSVSSVALNYNDNSMWFGTYDNGLISYDGAQTWAQYSTPASVANSRITGIDFDFENHVWAAMQSAVGEFDLAHHTWINIYDASSTNLLIPYNGANTVVTNKRNLRWFGTANGLVELNDTTWTKFDTTNSPLPNNYVRTLAYDARGNLWIGTRNGLAVYNPAGTNF